MRCKQALAKFVIPVISLSIGLLLCEVGFRLLLNPANYLSARTIQDDVLGITIEPNSSGFDEWGFRNPSVPPAADVVAIGDSHTYGNTAAMEDAWPAVVARETGLSVYNLGLGGYGPNQYYHLLTTKGLKLHPKWVVCGLYMGDDFENAFLITYGLDYWSSLRRGQWDHVNPDIWGNTAPVVWGADIRNWLSEHSMVYRLVFHGPLVGMMKEAIRFRQTAEKSDPYTTALTIEDRNIREAFRPIGMAERLDQNSGPVREGMRITFELLKKMDQTCKERDCRLLVAIIPTKETVFSEYLEKNSSVHLYEALQKVIVNERAARKVLIEFLDSAEIPYVDTLLALKQSVGRQLYAQTTRDMHPGKNGYRVIGETVAQYITRHDPQIVRVGHPH
jgi:hypothetical protein